MSSVAGARRGSPVLRTLASSAGARMVVLPISTLLGIVVTRLIIDTYGQAAYGQYMLLAGIAALIPFADLGITASIMNAVAGAKDPRDDVHLRRTLITSLRILAGSTCTVILVAIVLTAAGAWPMILGDAVAEGAGSAAAGLCLLVIGLTLTVSFGQRILIGLGLNHIMILIGGLQTPLVLLALLLVIRLELPVGDFLAVISYTAAFLLAAVMLALANRRIRPTLSEAVRGAVRVRSVRGARVWDTAWPLLVQMVTLPLAMQSGRVVLSHLGTLDDLTEYSLAWQMFNPVWAVAVAAGMSLWPVFARSRSLGQSAPSPFTLALAFGGVAVLGCVAIWLLSGFLAELASGGVITLTTPMLFWFSLLMIAQAAKNPLGMYLTDPPGLRFQAYMSVGVLVASVTISVLITLRVGAIGPVVGSVVGVTLFQVIANWLYVRRRLVPEPAPPP